VADWDAVRISLRARAAEWKLLMDGHVAQARQILRKVLVGPVWWHPVESDDLNVSREINLHSVISGANGCPSNLASPAGFALSGHRIVGPKLGGLLVAA
jgi:hypothetical protein